jgi:pimeloyl-ACP methyl ester carboxylesterase
MQALSRRDFGTLAFAAALALATGAAAQGGNAMGAIDEGLFVPINGMEQWITVRGRDRANPVLLILHGGPGFPMSFLAPALADWERDYTIVQWDQPGGGATHSRNLGRDPGPLTVDRYVADGLAVAEWARAHLGTDKIVLLGTSWGSMLGVTMARRRPDLFSAYVGVAQAVSGPEGARIGYELGLEAARARGDAEAVAALERAGPPPYARFEDFLVRQRYTNPPSLPPSEEEAAASAAQGALLSQPPSPEARYIARDLPPYDAWNVFLETQRATFAETWDWEARDQGRRFAMPVLVIQGENDLNAPVSLARDWLDWIEAPTKHFEIVPAAGHNLFVFPEQILALLNRHVRPVLAHPVS